MRADNGFDRVCVCWLTSCALEVEEYITILGCCRGAKVFKESNK